MFADQNLVSSLATAPLSMPEGLEARLRDRLHIANLRSAKPMLPNRPALGLALVGLGLPVMPAYNDAGGVDIYVQTGATDTRL